MAIVRTFAVAAMVTVILSALLASTIATPLRRLSAAAIRVRRGVTAREEIPDFGDRADEVGHLASAIRDMTNALYAAHGRDRELRRRRQPRAEEPPHLAALGRRDAAARAQRKLARAPARVIQHDVKRLDRLITDIADASRLDAELAREVAGEVDLAGLVGSVVDGARAHLKPEQSITIALTITAPPPGKTYRVAGHDLRLSQVFTNLIDNARSFVPPTGGTSACACSAARAACVVTIEDNGPGIQAEKIERIFERFYTDRPGAESFGQNSGLGLSISRQIVEAHGGEIRAENMADPKAPGASRCPLHRRASAET